MADRAFNGHLKTIGGRVRTVMLRLLVQSAAVTVVNSSDVAFSHPLVSGAVRDAAGKYTVTLRDPYRALLCALPSYATVEDNVDLYAQAGEINYGDEDPVTFTVKLKTASTNTDPNATGGIISVLLVFEDSSAYNA